MLLIAVVGDAASLGGIAVTEDGRPVAGATFFWRTYGACVPTYPHGTPQCSGSIQGTTRTGADGAFLVQNLPAERYQLCLRGTDPVHLATCDWQGFGDPGPSYLELRAEEHRTDLKLTLRRGSLLTIEINDPTDAVSQHFFLMGVYFGTGAYYGTPYDRVRRAFIGLVPKGLKGFLFFDTLLQVQDAAGNQLPVNRATMPFTVVGEETRFSLTALPLVVNAASYALGASRGGLATMFGWRFTDLPGVHVAGNPPLPTRIANTSVTVNGVPAPLIAVTNIEGRSQINFQVPHDYDFGIGAMDIVIDNDGRIQRYYAREAESTLGVFSVLAHRNGRPITTADPAQPGDEIVVYWTGLHGYTFVAPDGRSYLPDGLPAPEGIPCVGYLRPKVQIGGMPATVGSCGAAPGLAGVGQLVVTVPAALPSGTHEVRASLADYPANVVRVIVQRRD